MASTIASRLSVLMVKPSRYMIANAPTSDTGMVTSGTSTARQLRRNRKITSTTSSTAMPTVTYTSWMDFEMNTVES